MPANAYDAFVSSDFTYADLGYVDLNASYNELPSEHHDGKELYKLEETPEQRFYYARIVTLVDPETWLPVRREFFDPGTHLWKIETFDEVHTIDGVPTALHLRMEDVQAKSNSEITVSDVRFDIDVPDTLFDPSELREVASNPIFTDTATAGKR